ncbi:MAG TPA: peptide chain release factor N(5)-glutamine methyltransferase [Parafilimonas sp.]|nr:peptide chain release factor N(5)-glutamine methyltransferase [Parafilimonas sp.]
MTINEAYQYAKNELKKIYDTQEATNIANLAIEKISGLKRTSRILNKNQVLTIEQANDLHKYLEQLSNHKPVQYVLNEAWFAAMKFYVDENVLIPRPETEELVDWIVQDAKVSIQNSNINLSLNTILSSQNILDIGTGSGCIAIALKKKMNAEISAIDVSEAALKIASFNAQQNNTAISFFKADILQNEINIRPSLFDVIVSNPPYITNKESAEMNKNVIAHEPHIALFVPDEDPLLFYDAISNFALSHLKQNGKLFFEIHEHFGNEVVTHLKQKGFISVELKKDLQQKNRMVKAVLSK